MFSIVHPWGKYSLYFNNSNDYLNVAYFSSTCLLGLGCDCGVYVLHAPTTTTSKGLGQRRAKGTTSRLGRPTPISNGGDEGCWWLVVGSSSTNSNVCWCKLGVIMEPHILMNKPNVVARSARVNLIIVALLN